MMFRCEIQDSTDSFESYKRCDISSMSFTAIMFFWVMCCSENLRRAACGCKRFLLRRGTRCNMLTAESRIKICITVEQERSVFQISTRFNTLVAAVDATHSGELGRCAGANNSTQGIPQKAKRVELCG